MRLADVVSRVRTWVDEHTRDFVKGVSPTSERHDEERGMLSPHHVHETTSPTACLELLVTA